MEMILSAVIMHEPVSYSVIDKRTGWFALSGKMPFLYIATQVNSNMLLCFFFFELRRHMELENLAAPFYSAHK